jgi:hypothetical protein
MPPILIANEARSMPHPTGQLAKPTVLTPRVQATIVAALARGSYLDSACRGAGIAPGTYHYWARRVRDGDPTARGFVEFFAAVEKASAVAEVEALRLLQAGSPDWLAQAWFLSRRFPERWGRSHRRTDVGDG